MKRYFNPKTGKLTTEAPQPPVARITIASARHEPDSQIEWADVDRVALAIRAAKGGTTQPLFALYRDIVLTDAHVQTELSKRKLAVIGQELRVVPYDKKNAADVETAQFCEKQIWGTKDMHRALADLMDGVLWPVAVSEKLYAPADNGKFTLAALAHVPHYLLDYSSGHMQIRDTKPDGELVESSQDPDPSRYVIHRGHMLSTPDQFGGPMRALIFWWLASTMDRAWWVRFLERYGTPFIVGKYASQQDADRAILMAAMSQATKTFGLAVSKTTEVELVEATKSGADAFAAFMAVAQREKSKLILGQTLSSQTDSTGLGSGVAELHGEVREDIRKLDALMLANTLRDQLLDQICQINRLPGQTPYLVFGKATPAEVQALANFLTAAAQAGMEPEDDAFEQISDTVGLQMRRRAQPGPGLLPFDRLR